MDQPEPQTVQVPVAENFNDYVALMAANSPHSLVMDWWRRLNLALHEYAATLGQVVRTRDRRAIEETVPLDQALGVGFAALVRKLRLRRNQVAHKPICNLSSEDAAGYAREAFSLIAAIARRISHLEGKGQRPG